MRCTSHWTFWTVLLLIGCLTGCDSTSTDQALDEGTFEVTSEGLIIPSEAFEGRASFVEGNAVPDSLLSVLTGAVAGVIPAGLTLPEDPPGLVVVLSDVPLEEATPLNLPTMGIALAFLDTIPPSQPGTYTIGLPTGLGLGGDVVGLAGWTLTDSLVIAPALSGSVTLTSIDTSRVEATFDLTAPQAFYVPVPAVSDLTMLPDTLPPTSLRIANLRMEGRFVALRSLLTPPS